MFQNLNHSINQALPLILICWYCLVTLWLARHSVSSGYRSSLSHAVESQLNVLNDSFCMLALTALWDWLLDYLQDPFWFYEALLPFFYLITEFLCTSVLSNYWLSQSFVLPLNSWQTFDLSDCFWLLLFALIVPCGFFIISSFSFAISGTFH